MPGLDTGPQLALIAMAAALTSAGEDGRLCRLIMDAASDSLGDAPPAELARLGKGDRLAGFKAQAALMRVCGACRLCPRGAR